MEQKDFLKIYAKLEESFPGSYKAESVRSSIWFYVRLLKKENFLNIVKGMIANQNPRFDFKSLYEAESKRLNDIARAQKAIFGSDEVVTPGYLDKLLIKQGHGSLVEAVFSKYKEEDDVF